MSKVSSQAYYDCFVIACIASSYMLLSLLLYMYPFLLFGPLDPVQVSSFTFMYTYVVHLRSPYMRKSAKCVCTHSVGNFAEYTLSLIPLSA